jgi:pimeloyl-ACP methyl ester carboxylesterase
MRKLRVSLIGLFFLTLLAATAGYTYDRIATSRDKVKYPQMGQLVDLGGYRLLLYCAGQGSPTVLSDGGAFDSLEQWSTVQPQVAKFTRVCSYDRPGLGWSDPSPYPQTSQQIATELHAALTKRGIAGPFLPVGHSIAGLYARVFAAQYRNQVTGLVLEDSVYPDEFKEFPSHFPNHPIIFAMLRLTAPLGSARLLHVGCRQTGARPDCSKFVVNLIKQVDVVNTSYAQAGATGSLGALPVVVITHDPLVGLERVRDDKEEAAWTKWQIDLAHLSSNADLIVVQGVGHEIQNEKPEIVVNVIERLVSQWRNVSQ